MKKATKRITQSSLVAAYMLSGFSGVLANEQSGDLKSLEDIEARQVAVEASEKSIQIEETRIAGKLQRVTLRRSNGIDEIYENQNVDSMWLSEEKELGEIPNVRRWTIGSW
jgi:hypothetical protein